MTTTPVRGTTVEEQTLTAAPVLPPAPPVSAEDGSIRLIAENPIYENKYVTVNFDDVLFPNGATGNYTRITSGTGLGVIAVPVAQFRGMFYLGLVRQYRYPVGAFTLEFPRGGSDDLSLAEAARELVEETGLDYASASPLGIINPDTGIMDTRVAVWRTTHELTSLESLHVEEETGARIRWYAYGEVIGLITAGKITCAMTLAAMAMLQNSGKLVPLV